MTTHRYPRTAALALLRRVMTRVRLGRRRVFIGGGTAAAAAVVVVVTAALVVVTGRMLFAFPLAFHRSKRRWVRHSCLAYRVVVRGGCGRMISLWVHGIWCGLVDWMIVLRGIHRERVFRCTVMLVQWRCCR